MRDVSENLPAGGYLSTASDMVKFALAYNGYLVNEENRFLMSSPVAVKELNKNEEHSWRDAIPSKNKYGYGLMLFSKYDDGMIGHTGRQAGGSAILVLLPARNIAIAVMTNAKGWNGYLPFALKVKSVIDQYSEERPS
jgi:CubicO group peptidase (beta-lactamase class C family)